MRAAEKGSAFVRARRKDLDWIFSLQHERTVNQDNTISLENRVFQLQKTRWRNTLAGQTGVCMNIWTDAYPFATDHT